MDLHELAVETAEKQKQAESEAFERSLCTFNGDMAKTILIKAAETIDRLGKAAQDCKSCAKLPICNAYQAENSFENCDYQWTQADAVRRLCDAEIN